MNLKSFLFAVSLLVLVPISLCHAMDCEISASPDPLMLLSVDWYDWYGQYLGTYPLGGRYSSHILFSASVRSRSLVECHSLPAQSELRVGPGPDRRCLDHIVQLLRRPGKRPVLPVRDHRFFCDADSGRAKRPDTPGLWSCGTTDYKDRGLNMRKDSLLSIAWPACILAALPWASVAGQSPPALAAEIEIIHTLRLADGRPLERRHTAAFFRTADGRTRLDRGDSIVLTDPGSRTVSRIHQPTRSAVIYRAPAGRAGDAARRPQSEGVDLGSRTIEGFPVIGKKYVTALPREFSPALSEPLYRTVEVWHCPALALPLLSITDDPVVGRTTVAFKNIRVGFETQESLFRVPEAFTVKEAPAHPVPPNLP